MAERRYRSLEPDRAAQYDALREQMQGQGLHDRAQSLDDFMAAWQQDEGHALYGDPLTALLVVSTEAMSAAMADLGINQAHLAQAKVGSTMREDVSAQTVPFVDGSALVTISDAIMSLAHLYSQYTGVAFSRLFGTGGPLRLWRSVQATRKRSIGTDPTVLTGLLRYYNIHQRVFAKAAKLGWHPRPPASDSVSYILMQAVRFMVGHELSHHALCHNSKISAFSAQEHLPVCSANEQRELDADRLAYRALERACQRDLAGTPLADGGRHMALVGALVAMMTVNSTEEALFIHRGSSHPPAKVRANFLLSHLDSRQQFFAEILVGDLIKATDASSAFSATARPFDWVDFAGIPEIDTPHTTEYLQSITQLDELQCQPDANLMSMLQRATLPLAAAGAELLAAGDLQSCLRRWGFSTERADHLLHPDRAVTFHSVYESIQGRFAEEGLPNAELLAMPLISTQLFANKLQSL